MFILNSLSQVAIPLLVTRLLLNMKKIGEGRGTSNTSRIISTLMFARQNERELEDEEELDSIGRDSDTDVGADDQNMTGVKEKTSSSNVQV